MTQAFVTGRPAVVFNTAGLNPGTLAPYKVDMKDARNLITAYNTRNDPLSFAQDNKLAIGTTMKMLGLLGGGVGRLIGSGLGTLVQRMPSVEANRIILPSAPNTHSILSVIEAMGQTALPSSRR